MDREKMIEVIVNDMEDWMKRDRSGFWDHIQGLERDYLANMTDAELNEVYRETV